MLDGGSLMKKNQGKGIEMRGEHYDFRKVDEDNLTEKVTFESRLKTGEKHIVLQYQGKEHYRQGKQVQRPRGGIRPVCQEQGGLG